MRTAVVFLALAFVSVLPASAAESSSSFQRGARGARGGSATFAVHVVDPSGAPVSGVRVTISGPVERSATTEGGRIAFENLPLGTYHFRFEHADYDALERDVVGKRGAPIDVDVTLTPKPQPVALPPAPPTAPAPDTKPVILDLPTFIEKNYVGKSAGKTTPVACASGGSSTLIQINDALNDQAHANADEFIYVIAGQGTLKIGSGERMLAAGEFMMIPRATPHAFTPGPKKPLVMVAIRAGEGCSQ